MLAAGVRVVPFDRHRLGLDSVVAGEGFVEESTTWLQRRWRHERTLSDEPGGTRITDVVTVEPRLGLARPITKVVVGRTFDHRHHRLATRFGLT